MEELLGAGAYRRELRVCMLSGVMEGVYELRSEEERWEHEVYFSKLFFSRQFKQELYGSRRDIKGWNGILVVSVP